MNRPSGAPQVRPVVPGRGRSRHPHRPGSERRPTRGCKPSARIRSGTGQRVADYAAFRRSRIKRAVFGRRPAAASGGGRLQGCRYAHTAGRRGGFLHACAYGCRDRTPDPYTAESRQRGPGHRPFGGRGGGSPETRSGAGRRPKDTVPDSGADCATTMPETFESGSPARLKSVIAQDTSGGAAPDRRSECRGRSAPNADRPDPDADMRVWGRRRGRRRRFLHRRCVFPHASGPPTARAQDQLRRRRYGG